MSPDPAGRSVPDPSDVFVLVPDRYGLAVCAVGDLMRYLDDDDTTSLDDAITNAAIDSASGRDLAEIEAHIARVRALNETGDANAYWNLG